MLKQWIKCGLMLVCVLKINVYAATNPIDIVFEPLTGLPATTHVGDQYTVAYQFSNNLPIPVLIHVTATTTSSGFSSDGLCANATLSANGQLGSTCTTYIDFKPTHSGNANYNLTLQYHNNVISVLPHLSTFVNGVCGDVVYPSNTGIPVPDPILNSNQVWRFISAADLHPMIVNVSSYVASQLATGLIFNGPYAGSGSATYGQSGALIVDNDANPIWFRPLSSPSLMNTDVKVQTLNNQSVLTFWQGTLATPPSYTDLPAGGAEPGSCFYIFDQSYHILNTITAFNDFVPDVHEFLITPNQTVIFLATKVISMDLTPYGGPSNGAIHDFSIQEVNLATNTLVFFWDAIDHIPLSSSFLPAATASETSNVWDPYHLNSISLIGDSPDDLLISGRNTWTIYRLNKTTGNFVWKLVGDGSGDFAIPDPKATFAWQHDARFNSGNIISMFDDECCGTGTIPPGTVPSHGLVLNLDLVNKVATLNRSYFHNPNVNSNSQGNNQFLSNNNRFVGFGSIGSYTENAEAGNTELTPSLNILYSAQMPGSNVSYRSYRETWIGTPYYLPNIAAQTNAHYTTIYASWNGATEVTSWQVYAGNYSDHLTLVAIAVKTGFETAININKGWTFFQVKALNSQAQVIGTSKIIFQS